MFGLSTDSRLPFSACMHSVAVHSLLVTVNGWSNMLRWVSNYNFYSRYYYSRAGASGNARLALAALAKPNVLYTIL